MLDSIIDDSQLAHHMNKERQLSVAQSFEHVKVLDYIPYFDTSCQLTDCNQRVNSLTDERINLHLLSFVENSVVKSPSHPLHLSLYVAIATHS